MSRVGKKPITVPAGVTVTVHPDRIDFEGKKGKLSTPLQPGIAASLEGTSLVFTRSEDTKTARTNHGLGLVIVSTSRGLMTGRACEEQGTGGEVLCSIW